MDEIERIVAQTILDVLGAAPPSKDIPLADMGMDSIDALDLFYTLEDRFDINKLHDSGERYDNAITQRLIEDKVRRVLATNAIS